MTHTRGSGDCCEEGCECGYYYLHRDLNNAIALHTLASFRLNVVATVVVVTTAAVVVTASVSTSGL
jgi:hypothetical protein